MPYADTERQKAYCKRHYEGNKALYKARAKAHTIKTRAAIKAYMRKLKSVPCGVCKKTYHFACMDFAHKDRYLKAINIGDAAALGWSLKKIIIEVAKCDVLCANCHRIKTYQENIELKIAG